MRATLLTALLALLPAAGARADPPTRPPAAQEIEFFEGHVRPVTCILGLEIDLVA